MGRTAVGRMGAIAVAVGIGYAVTGIPASADATDSSEAGDVTSAPARQGRTPRANPPRPSPAHRGAGSSTAIEQIPDTALTSRAAALDRAHLEPPAVEQSMRHINAPRMSAAAVSAPARSAAIGSAPAPSAAAGWGPSPSETANNAPEAIAPVPAATTVNAVTPAATLVSAPVNTTAAAAAPPKPAPTLGSLISAALSPLFNVGTGAAPGQNPLLFGVLSWARREFERITGITLPAAVTTTDQAHSPNLLVNPGAEVGDPSLSGMSAVSIPGWTVKGTPTVIPYGAERTIWAVGLPAATPDLPSMWSFPKARNGAADGGNQFFGGGNVADATISQTVDLSAASAAIDGGKVSYTLGAWLGGYGLDPSAASVKVTFLDANKSKIGAGRICPVTALDRLFGISLLPRSTTGKLPTGTRYARVDVIFDDKNPTRYGLNADYNDAFADNISFTVATDLPAPPPPAPIPSKPPALDHVFMVYMENKGYSDILGSPNGPYLNSLMKTYGLADNYYALTHGSSPNYYPIVGGTDYGITYNCKDACIDAPAEQTLPGRLDLAGKTWRAYANREVDPAAWDDESADVFRNFQWISEDPAYEAAHILPLDRLAADLQSPATAPNYAWVFPPMRLAGEGTDKLRFYLNFLTPGHQYDVAGLDEFLADAVPKVLNSPVWKDPTQKSVMVITFDEDTNNISLGFGNEGNHIVTVVIPSEGAIAAGMRGGGFTARNQYNHYSLLRFIDDALGVEPITNNDKFATPMNEFWNESPSATSGSVAI